MTRLLDAFRRQVKHFKSIEKFCCQFYCFLWKNISYTLFFRLSGMFFVILEIVQILILKADVFAVIGKNFN